MKTPCVNWEGCIQWNGYGKLRRNDKSLLAHRVAYANAYGEVPKGMWVLHKCDNRRCVNPYHLFLGTAKDNTQDMIKKCRGSWGHSKGERNGKAKLKDSEVRAMRKSYVPKRGAKAALARRFGCGWTTVNNILSRRTRREASA